VPENDVRETEHQHEHLHESGGLRYQRAHRVAGAAHDDASKATAGGRSEIARETGSPAQDQRADHHGGPGPDDEAWLADQGYPKLGKKMQSRLTQVEHGPYAGGTQQGDAGSPGKARRSGKTREQK
jgi:hypothetical protein